MSSHTIVIPAADLAAATAFYRVAWGAEPHTETPYYVGFNLDGQEIVGIIKTDSASTVAVNMKSGSTWTLTGDSYVTSLSGDTSGINLNGYTLYVNGSALAGTTSEEDSDTDQNDTTTDNSSDDPSDNPSDEPSDVNPFTDVQSSDYFFDPVKWAVANLITTGTTSTTFSPDENFTRAQMVTFLWRAAGSPEPTTSSNPFTDVKEDAYYYKAVLWASENGIANGYNSGEYAGKYGVGLPCLREHMVTFLSRYWNKFGK